MTKMKTSIIFNNDGTFEVRNIAIGQPDDDCHSDLQKVHQHFAAGGAPLLEDSDLCEAGPLPISPQLEEETELDPGITAETSTATTGQELDQLRTQCTEDKRKNLLQGIKKMIGGN